MNDRLTDRRAFLKTSTGAAAALATGVTILPSSRARAANDRCVVGMIGVEDRFGESGQPWELVHEFELSAEHIAAKVLALRGQPAGGVHS